MSAEKSNYPDRKTRRSRPKSSDSGVKGRKKTWTSDGSVFTTMGGPRQIRSNRPWYKTPARIEERMANARSRVTILSEGEWFERRGLWPEDSYDEYVARKQRQIG